MIGHGLKRFPNVPANFARVYAKFSKADLAELVWSLAARLDPESFDAAAQDPEHCARLLAEEAAILAGNGVVTVNCARRCAEIANPKAGHPARIPRTDEVDPTSPQP